jgi:mono/diheme cytochrome c family protein
MTPLVFRSSLLTLVALAGLGCAAVLPPGFGQASPAPGATTSVSFKTDVVPVLQEHCARCHGAGGQGSGAITMFDSKGAAQYDAIKTNIVSMLAAIKGGRMPLDKPNSVPADKVQKLDDWQKGGAPNN